MLLCEALVRSAHDAGSPGMLCRKAIHVSWMSFGWRTVQSMRDSERAAKMEPRAPSLTLLSLNTGGAGAWWAPSQTDRPMTS